MMARGRVRLGSFTSSAMLTMPSKPMNANTANRDAVKMPLQMPGSPLSGSISGRRETISGSNRNPAAITMASPPSSMIVMTPGERDRLENAARRDGAHRQHDGGDDDLVRQWDEDADVSRRSYAYGGGGDERHADAQEAD